MEIIKKNITLVLGISIPILMILFVAGSIYLPGLFIKPHFNFLYASGYDSYYYYNNGYQYSVQNDKLIKNEIKQPENQNYTPPRVEQKLYLYDVAKNESKEISFAQAALGGEVNIETVDGDLKLRIPSGTQPGTAIRLRGKGVPHLHGSGRGDHYVRVKVTVPKHLTGKQKELLQEFQEEAGKNGWF